MANKRDTETLAAQTFAVCVGSGCDAYIYTRHCIACTPLDSRIRPSCHMKRALGAQAVRNYAWCAATRARARKQFTGERARGGDASAA